MWVSQEISEKSKNNYFSSYGLVTSINNSLASISSGQEYRNLPMVSPFGVVSVPSIGSKAVVMPIDNGFAFLGTVQNLENLNPGEVMLYSAGGANIVLKNNGKVLINGNEIS